MKVFYSKIENIAFVVVSAYNRGHAVDLIHKKLRESALTAEFVVEEIDTNNKRGDIALVWSRDE